MHALLLTTLLAVPVQGDDVTLPDFEALEARWRAAMETLGVPGMAVAVVLNDELVYQKTFGQRDTEAELPVTEDTIFYIASATKPFVAMALAALAEEGEVDLDMSVKDYLPRFEVADELATVSITVRDLLCHRPGINSSPIVFLDAYTGEITEDRYYHFLAEVRPTGEVLYSNVHFTIAGRVIEAVTGEPWREYLNARIFAPAGLTRTTGYADWMYAQGDVAIPTVWTPEGFEPAPVRKSDTTMHAAGGLGTSIHDAARWLRLNLAGGVLDGERVVPEAAVTAMQEPQSSFGAPDGSLRRMEGFGLGWQRGTYRGERYFQHGGGYVGSTSHFSFLPDVGLGVAVLANTDAGGQALASIVSIDVYDRSLGDESGYDPLSVFAEQVAGVQARIARGGTETDEPPEAEALALDPAACVGDWANELWGTVRLAFADGRFTAAMGNLRATVRVTGPDRFHASAPGALDSDGRFELEDGAPVALVMELEGREVRFER